jgi:hypothetical protein
MKPLCYFQTAAITFALALGNNATAFCQSQQNSPSQVQKVKDQVQKFGIAEDVTVILLTGKEYYGAISKIESDIFEIAEVDMRQKMSFDYKDVKKVRKGYGDQHLITGKRGNPRTQAIIAIVVVGALFGLAILAVPKT